MPNMAKNDKYSHDIGKWALVKICNYPIVTICSNVLHIPNYVLRSLNIPCNEKSQSK